jgi:hypothetical protein
MPRRVRSASRMIGCPCRSWYSAGVAGGAALDHGDRDEERGGGTAAALAHRVVLAGGVLSLAANLSQAQPIAWAGSWATAVCIDLTCVMATREGQREAARHRPPYF